MLGLILGSIPSPSSGQLQLGPLRLTAYGLMIALGVIAAVDIARRRHTARGGARDDFSEIAVWAVIAGLLGARAYHVLTDLERFEGRWLDAFKIWQGGLGIPGGLLAGVMVGLWSARRHGLGNAYTLDIVAPALPVAQAIGRWGNWWNQELFGRPTDLPWGLRIDPAHRPDGYEDVGTYHPTFLYESLWNLALAGFVVWLERRTRGRLRPGSLFAVYVAGYGMGRLWVESLRIDPAQYLLGVRFNLLIAGLAVVGGLGWLAVAGRRVSPPSDGQAAATGADGVGDPVDDRPGGDGDDAGPVGVGGPDEGPVSAQGDEPRAPTRPWQP